MPYCCMTCGVGAAVYDMGVALLLSLSPVCQVHTFCINVELTDFPHF
jgi:hypothetical protein